MNSSNLNYSIWEPEPPRPFHYATGGLTCGHNQMAITNDGGLHQRCMVCGQEYHEPNSQFQDVFSRRSLQTPDYTFDSAMRTTTPRYDIQPTRRGHKNPSISKDGGCYQQCRVGGQEINLYPTDKID